MLFTAHRCFLATSNLMIWLMFIVTVTMPTIIGCDAVSPLGKQVSVITDIRPLPISSVPYSSNEKREHKQLWREIKKSCNGSWSGSLAAYGIRKKNKLTMRKQPRLNFRLHCKTKSRRGTWTVWNLVEQGDEITVPMRLRPEERSPLLKMTFAGVIMRFPCAISPAFPRFAFEIGFWGKSVRRTVVHEYKPKNKSWMPGWFASSSSLKADDSESSVPWDLDEVTLIQSERQPSRGFIGNHTEPSHIDFLPTKTTGQTVEDIDWSLWHPVKSESVDLETWERSKNGLKKKKKTEGEFPYKTRDEVRDHVAKAFALGNPLTFVSTLPTAISASVPYQLDPVASDGEDIHALFAHKLKGKEMVVVDLQYKGQVAKRVTMYTFRYKG